MCTILMSKSVANIWKHSVIPTNHYEKNCTDIFKRLFMVTVVTRQQDGWSRFDTCPDSLWGPPIILFNSVLSYIY